MKKTLAVALTAAFVFGASVTTFAASSFSDVPATHWAYSAVRELSEAEIIPPSADGKFYGSRNITRFEMAQMATNLLKYYSPSLTKDADEILEDASRNGNKEITRYETAAMLADVYKKIHKGNLPTASKSFTDIPDNHWAKNSVDLMAAAKLMEGYVDDSFRGDNTMNRFEAAILIDKMYRGLSQ